MSTVEELIAKLRAKDVRLWADDGKLRISGRSDALTPSLRAAISERKGELLAYLASIATVQSHRPPIARRSGTGPLPLSFVQERIWFLHQLDPEGSAHNIAITHEVGGPLDIRALERSFEELLRRHDALRSTFPESAGEPVCVVSPRASVDLEVVDLAGLSQTERRSESARRTSAEVRRPFDIERGPLIRFLLLRRAPDDNTLLITQHHIVTDRWSLGIIANELATLYGAYSVGEESPLEELPIQYGDFAIWQREWMQGAELERQLAFWKERVKAPFSPLALPTDRPRPALLSTAASAISRVLPLSLRHELGELARAEGCSLFMVLLAGFQALLSRHTGQRDIGVGSPVAGRLVPEVEGLAGCFINTLVLRADLSGDPTFRELLARARKLLLDALTHQDLPFEKLVREVDPVRDPSRSPLVQVTFTFQNVPKAVEVKHGVNVESTGGSIFDLELYVVETDEGLHSTLEYNRALFDRPTAERILERFEVLLRGAAADPERHLHELPLQTAEECRQLVEWNGTGRRAPEGTVVDLVERQAALSPDRVAVVSADKRLTYAELSRRSSLLAGHLAERGVAGGTRVAVAIERSTDLVVGLLGALKSGACYVPLDPAHPRPRIDFMLRDARVGLVLTQRSLMDRWDDGTAPVVAVDDESVYAAGAGISPSGLPRGEDPAYVIYTSGSTGDPKGVQVPHSALTNFLHSMAREPGMAEDDVLLSVTTPAFDISLLELFLPLTVGATVVVATGEQTDGHRLAVLLADSRATVLQATPATWRLLLDAGWEGDPRLRMLCGGEALSRDLATHLLARGAGLWNLYGPTETTIWSTVERVREGEGPVPIGRPIDNTRVVILDEFRQAVPLGVPGEICIGGDGLARGYLGRPELTADRFIPDPTIEAGEGMLYRTGDLGRYRFDGRLEYLGRIDDQIKVRGFRIEPAEIEVLLRRHEALRDVVVVPRGDRLVAFVIFENGMDLTATEVRRLAAEALPEYMVPSMVIPLNAFPLTPNGKVDRKALPDPFERGQLAHEGNVPPATPEERLVADVWREVLDADDIGVHDNFYEVGGHSLLSIRVVHAIEERTGYRLNPRVMFFQSLKQIASSLPAPREAV